MSFFFINCSSQKEFNSITTSELKVLLEQDYIQLLDVRTATEIEDGFIKTAKFADYFAEDFYTKASNQLDKEKTVYVYCRSGNRSSKSAKILQDNGFKVVNVLGGYKQWEKEN
ncbi:rhodanese-like domain-containing protein [Polaribacter sp. IC066]|nr:rhodanese-like domain-containing protein [Polaribacter sp. IC063]TXD61521.1 rhodanese-like domain-containing protein [Polaribacter sp. IC066]